MTSVGAPSTRRRHTAVWTGDEMIVWGGQGQGGDWLDTGGRFDPLLGSWSDTTTVGAPLPRFWHTAVWTGSEMIAWGGYPYSTGACYCVPALLFADGFETGTVSAWSLSVP